MNARPVERTVLVTGGAGFIGSAVCRLLVADGSTRVVNLDKLTYAASPTALVGVAAAPNYRFVQGDIDDRPLVASLLAEERIDAVMHLAAESHVDRSLADAGQFIATNITGTYHLLEAVLDHWRGLDGVGQERFRFLHVSTDEVFGDLPYDSGSFDEDSPYRPSSPYAASKAAADHLVRAWARSYDLPVLLTNCSNNYGPFQHPEKLIPLTITRALRGEPVPVYGDGENVRDWMHVEDHARALDLVLRQGEPGRTYAIGAREEQRNIAVVTMICDLLDARVPRPGMRRRDLIRFVADRRGHDRRYAIDPARIEAELEWRPARSFEEGLAATVGWYVAQEGAA
ncbi:dTDP-glucose 4,6-dehydratase [Sphingomonas sp. RT2P30]|uniref:dTDP-glucose 4,6-dehydratase n=1 Tax=Parasphingomonas halimpatiens TaxID=3096162 RepID=UPI002FCB56CB